MGLFQCSLDCFLIGVLFKIKTFYLQQSLYTGVHLLQFLNAVICSLITTFFKCIKLHQVLSQFSTINLAQVLDINIFGRDYSNLNNPIPSKDINLQYICKIYCGVQGQHLMQQKKKDSFGTTFFKKISYLGFFFFFFLIQCQKSSLPSSIHFQ